MSRTARLLQLVQVMRRQRRPVAARTLAAELGTSIRTIYRDIDTLVAQGFQITGEAGLGYVLMPGSLMPPLMFTEEELEAVVLGLRWVNQRGDSSLAAAANDARAKIRSVLPLEQQQVSEHVGLLAGPGPCLTEPVRLREAIRKELKLKITYTDSKDSNSVRIVWPVALAFFENVRVLVAWCETRADFRSFRTDRLEIVDTFERYAKRRPCCSRNGVNEKTFLNSSDSLLTRIDTRRTYSCYSNALPHRRSS